MVHDNLKLKNVMEEVSFFSEFISGLLNFPRKLKKSDYIEAGQRNIEYAMNVVVSFIRYNMSGVLPDGLGFCSAFRRVLESAF